MEPQPPKPQPDESESESPRDKKIRETKEFIVKHEITIEEYVALLNRHTHVENDESFGIYIHPNDLKDIFSFHSLLSLPTICEKWSLSNIFYYAKYLPEYDRIRFKDAHFKIVKELMAMQCD